MPYLQALEITNEPDKSKPTLKAIKDKCGQSLNMFNTAAPQADLLGGITQINDGISQDLPEQLIKYVQVENSVIEELKNLLNDKQLVSFAGNVALSNFTNRLKHGLDIELP